MRRRPRDRWTGHQLGIGTALFSTTLGADADATVAAIVSAAVGQGIRYFDTAALYYWGEAESLLGQALASMDRSSVTVSTKVGYLLGADMRSTTRDFSRDGILSSLDGSLERLRTDYVDVVYLHDPADQSAAAFAEAYATVAELRRQEVVRAIGVGVNQVDLTARWVRDTDLDVVLLAGRYTLLDRSGAAELLPACAERGVAVVVGGVFNTGILATGEASSTYDYREPDAGVVARVTAMKRACDRHGVPLRAAALQFPGRHPAVATTLVGVTSVGEVNDNVEMAQVPVPQELWDELDDLPLLVGG